MDDEWRSQVDRRIGALENRMDSLTAGLSENTAMTQAIRADTMELLQIFRASKFGAAIVKWGAGIGASIIVGYAAFKGLK